MAPRSRCRQLLVEVADGFPETGLSSAVPHIQVGVYPSNLAAPTPKRSKQWRRLTSESGGSHKMRVVSG